MSACATPYLSFSPAVFVTTARCRGARRAVIQFGPPVPVAPFQEMSVGARALTEALEQRVRGLLGELLKSEGRLRAPGVPVVIGQPFV